MLNTIIIIVSQIIAIVFAIGTGIEAEKNEKNYWAFLVVSLFFAVIVVGMSLTT